MREKMKNSFYLSKRIFLQHYFDNGVSQLTNQNSDQSKFKLTLTNQNLNSLSMWRVYNLRHTTVFTYSHANTPLGQSERAYYHSYFMNTTGSKSIEFLTNIFATKLTIFIYNMLQKKPCPIRNQPIGRQNLPHKQIIRAKNGVTSLSNEFLAQSVMDEDVEFLSSFKGLSFILNKEEQFAWIMILSSQYHCFAS